MAGKRVVLDVSGYQPRQIDFARIKAEAAARGVNVCGGVAKINEGNWTYSNPFAEQQLASMAAAGFELRAGYMFERPGAAGTADAEAFLQRIRPLKLNAVALDCEASDGLPPAVVAARIREDAEWIRREWAFRDMIYTGGWWWDPNVASVIPGFGASYALWVAGYLAEQPPLPMGWTSALMWQFTDKFPTYFGGVDASYFQGTEQQWQWLVRGALPLDPAMTAAIQRMQYALHVPTSGHWDEATDKVLAFIRAVGLAQPNLPRNDTVMAIQAAWSMPLRERSGRWDSATEAAYQFARAAFAGK